jgi:hypothetical protein
MRRPNDDRGLGSFPITVKGNTVATSYAELPNKLVSAANGVSYAFRDAGEGEVPLVLFNHFRGNLDSWDPALVDALAGTTNIWYASTGPAAMACSRAWTTTLSSNSVVP